MTALRSILAIAVIVALAGAASGDEAAAAKRFFISGSKHFDLGEYTEALNDFKEGYRLKDDPVFLYNIAQCHRLLNQNTDALRAYKTYLRRAPTAPNRGEVERKIAAIEEAQAAANKASTTPPNQVLPPDAHASGEPAATPSPATTTTAPATSEPSSSSSSSSNALTASAPASDRQPIYKKWWLWTAVGVVAVGAGLGIGLGVGLSKGKSNTTVYPAVQF